MVEDDEIISNTNEQSNLPKQHTISFALRKGRGTKSC